MKSLNERSVYSVDCGVYLTSDCKKLLILKWLIWLAIVDLADQTMKTTRGKKNSDSCTIFCFYYFNYLKILNFSLKTSYIIQRHNLLQD